MTPPTIACAVALRDGGIDAMAALDDALREAIAGVSAEHADELKLAFGRVMAEVSDTLINPAVRAYPQLNPDEPTWIAVAKARAGARFNAP